MKRIDLVHATLCLLSMIFLIQCRNTESNSAQPIQPVNLDLIEFDQLLCGADTLSIDRIQSLYPDFTDVFFYQILFPNLHSNIPLDSLRSAFCQSGLIQHLRDTTSLIYADKTMITQKLATGFAHLQSYFPTHPIPQVFTFVSEFGIGCFTIEDHTLGIGLDFFLGEDYPYYDVSVFPYYMRPIMSKPYMVSQAFHAVAENLVPPLEKTKLLDYMIRNGKILYLKEKFLPNEPANQLFLYTPDEMEWVRNNELQIWEFYLDNQLLYEQDKRKFIKYIDRAPNSPGMPESAPSRTANYIGYKIISQYMMQNPDMSPADLLAEMDAQKILNESQYKPPRL